MAVTTLGISYNKQEIRDYWRHPFPPDDLNNNTTQLHSNNLAEPCLILLSNNLLDCNYKTKRQRTAETNLREQLNIQPAVVISPRVMPCVGNIQILSSILRLSDFNLTAQLGKGSFGTVFAAEFIEGKRDNPLKVAIKVIQTSSNTKHKEQLYNSFISELNVKGLKHPNIVQQFGYNDCDLISRNAFIIYELCGTQNLKQFLIDSERVLTISKRKSMSLDLIKAAEFIHSIFIVHMDIKPANIIITNNLVCKLTDFGCSIKVNKPVLFGIKENEMMETAMDVDEYEDNRWTVGTWYYRAPELFRGDDKDFTHRTQVANTKCDIYSLGIVMWQLLTRESSPYHEYHENPQVVIYQIVSKGLRPKFPVVATNIKSSYRNLDHWVSDDVLAYSKSNSVIADNSEFERVYRNLIELSWSEDPNRRYDAKTLRDVLTGTIISY